MERQKKILVITDNRLLYNEVKRILDSEYKEIAPSFAFKRSKTSSKKRLYTAGIEHLEEVNIKEDYTSVIRDFDIVISLHCKQIFPSELVNNKLCINIHPGYNPYNRGWYPQVFAIIEGNRLGATIHVMDEQVDHGAIIARKEVTVKSYYTSKEAYEEVLKAEIDLFRKNITQIVSGNFTVSNPEKEGEYHSIDDYNRLCHLNPDEKLTMGEAIDKLRALSHGEYKNAYFIDKDGNKIYVKLELTKSETK